MTLGEIVRNYREEHGLSQREFAEISGLSSGYISMLEKNRNPRTGEPIIPKIDVIKKVATAMGTTAHSLMEKMGDSMVSLDEFTAEDGELDAQIMILIRQLTPELKHSVYELLQVAVDGLRKR